MDIFLIPVGDDRYELYCEVPDEPAAAEAEGVRPPGFFRRFVHTFRDMLAVAERERLAGGAALRAMTEEADRRRWTRRLKDRTLRWVAEAIAEQRLLWHLRRQRTAALIHPGDLDGGRAMGIARAALERDFRRHRFWLGIDAVLLLGAALLTPIPGPNLLAYYFVFRVVGHWLSLRGARQGLQYVAWRTVSSAPLAELRAALALPGTERRQQVLDVAGRLRLQHLATFFERTLVPAGGRH